MKLIKDWWSHVEAAVLLAWFQYFPWAKAHLEAAVLLYVLSDRYEQREEIVGRKYAQEMFLKSKIEQRIFKRQVWQHPVLALRVIFTPYGLLEDLDGCEC